MKNNPIPVRLKNNMVRIFCTGANRVMETEMMKKMTNRNTRVEILLSIQHGLIWCPNIGNNLKNQTNF
jgi:hypothetical protein